MSKLSGFARGLNLDQGVGDRNLQDQNKGTLANLSADKKTDGKFHAAEVLARLIERTEGPSSLSQIFYQFGSSKLGSSRDNNLRAVYQALSADQQRSLEQSIGQNSLAELFSLSEERDSGVFLEGLLNFGLRLQAQGKFDLASAVFSSVQEVSKDTAPNIQRRAETRLNAIVGKGAFGARVEYLVSRFIPEATDYKMILPMMLGTMVGSVAKLA